MILKAESGFSGATPNSARARWYIDVYDFRVSRKGALRMAAFLLSTIPHDGERVSGNDVYPGLGADVKDLCSSATGYHAAGGRWRLAEGVPRPCSQWEAGWQSVFLRLPYRIIGGCTWYTLVYCILYSSTCQRALIFSRSSSYSVAKPSMSSPVSISSIGNTYPFR